MGGMGIGSLVERADESAPVEEQPLFADFDALVSVRARPFGDEVRAWWLQTCFHSLRFPVAGPG